MRCPILLLILLVFLSPTEAFSESSALPSPAPSSEVPSSTPTLKTEVVGFSLEGKRVMERFNIDDLDAVVTPSGQRLLPLLRLLKALGMEFEESEEIISFTPAPGVKIILNLQRKEVQIKDRTRSISPVVGVSDITLQKDIYFSPEVLEEILFIKIEWSDQDYKFFAKTDQRLGIWKISQGGSVLSIKTHEIPANLPEPFPPANPGYFSLDFMELQFRPFFTTSTSQGGSSSQASLGALQTFWGNSFGGQYRLQFSEQQVSYYNTGFQSSKTSPIMLNRGDLAYSFPDAEIAAGDSIFGLNDLTFPVVRMCGLRFNGLGGFPREDSDWRSSPGLGSYIIPPRVFEGTAPVGSKVELVINDRSIETQTVSVGSYRFEDIRLTPGALNLIRLIITEPSGYQRVIEESIFGRSIHLPKGGFSYLGGTGTNRLVYNWETRGLFGGGRALYGLTDSLTLGTTWAAQNSFYIPISTSLLDSDPNLRQYPQQSYHAGAQALWLPLESLLLSGDMSRSNGGIGSYADEVSPDEVSLNKIRRNQTPYDGFAYKLKGELYPWPNFSILSQYFHYDRNFFNGENVLLRDKEGYSAFGRWNMSRQWWVSSTVGNAWNLKNTLNVDFQNLEIGSGIIPKMTIAAGVNRSSANWEDGGPAILYILKVQASPTKNIYFDGFFSQGKYLDATNQETMDFFSGLRIPGFSEFRPPIAAANLLVNMTAGNSGGVAYWQDPNRRRPSIFHNYRLPEKPIRVRNEVGYDFTYEKPYFDNRTEYLFDRFGQKSIGINTHYEEAQFTVSLLISFTELLSHSRGTLTRVPESGISPDRGGVHGRVFIDSNANGIMDPGEGGVENVRVILDNVHKTLTGKDGYFLLSAIGLSKKSRVFLDIETVPAIYSPTSAIQTALLNPKGLTEVNFGLAPLNSIAGLIQTISPDKGVKPLYGIRVYLTSITDDKVIADSITAQDGSYYIGDIKPGKYYLRVDAQTLPSKHTIPDRRLIEVAPKKEPQELKIPPITCIPAAEEEKERPPVPNALKTGGTG